MGRSKKKVSEGKLEKELEENEVVAYLQRRELTRTLETFKEESCEKRDEKKKCKTKNVVPKISASSSDNDGEGRKKKKKKKVKPPKKKKRERKEEATESAPRNVQNDHVSDTDVSDTDVSDTDVSDTDVSSSSDDETSRLRRREALAKKASDAALAAANWKPAPAPVPSGLIAAKSKPFTRVDSDHWGEIVRKEGTNADNSYQAVFGNAGFGAKSSEKLLQVRGKGFRHEKTKRKRSFNGFSRNGGRIGTESNSTKYSYDDDH